jgi:hypothetical protein
MWCMYCGQTPLREDAVMVKSMQRVSQPLTDLLTLFFHFLFFKKKKKKNWLSYWNQFPPVWKMNGNFILGWCSDSPKLTHSSCMIFQLRDWWFKLQRTLELTLYKVKGYLNRDPWEWLFVHLPPKRKTI